MLEVNTAHALLIADSKYLSPPAVTTTSIARSQALGPWLSETGLQDCGKDAGDIVNLIKVHNY